MPNVKLFVEEGVLERAGTRLDEALGPLCELLCDRLGVGRDVCHLAVVPVRGMPGQAQVNVEMMVLERDGRDRDRLLDLCREVRTLCAEAVDARAEVRVLPLDPAKYVALR